MKTLIVSYIPRNEQSNTKKLLDAFREEIGIADVEELDLLVDVPDMFLDSNLLAYINRNFLGQQLILNEEIKQANLNKAISEVRATAREWYEKKEFQ